MRRYRPSWQRTLSTSARSIQKLPPGYSGASSYSLSFSLGALRCPQSQASYISANLAACLKTSSCSLHGLLHRVHKQPVATAAVPADSLQPALPQETRPASPLHAAASSSPSQEHYSPALSEAGPESAAVAPLQQRETQQAETKSEDLPARANPAELACSKPHQQAEQHSEGSDKQLPAQASPSESICSQPKQQHAEQHIAAADQLPGSAEPASSQSEQLLDGQQSKASAGDLPATATSLEPAAAKPQQPSSRLVQTASATRKRAAEPSAKQPPSKLARLEPASNSVVQPKRSFAVHKPAQPLAAPLAEMMRRHDAPPPVQRSTLLGLKRQQVAPQPDRQAEAAAAHWNKPAASTMHAVQQPEAGVADDQTHAPATCAHPADQKVAVARAQDQPA